MYYKHSGHFSLGGLLIGTGIGIPAGLLLGFLYSHGLVLISDERMAMLATASFGVLLGLTSGYGFVWGKVRNQAVASAATGTISVIALYASWAVWVSLTLESQHVDAVGWTKLAENPGQLWGLIRTINEYGTWSLGSDPVTKGMALWAVWFIEAAVVIGLAISVQIAALSRHAFCETCESWCSRRGKIEMAAPQNLPQFKLQLEANDLRPLEGLGPGIPGADFLLAELDSCMQCRQLNTLSLTLTTIRRSKLGKPTIRKNKIVEHLLIGQAPAQALLQFSEKTAMAAKVARAKAKSAAAGRK